MAAPLAFWGETMCFQASERCLLLGGSGLFRLARGYAQAKTREIDFKTGNATVEYNVYVFHY
jgi:hypothetical protein